MALTQVTSDVLTSNLSFSGATTISVADNTNAALKITQTGTGNALLIEDDSSNPDSTPFVIDVSGNAILGYTSRVTSTNSLELHSSAAVAATAGIGGYNWNASGSYYPALALFKSRGGAVNTYSSVASGDNSRLQFWFDDGTQFVRSAEILGAVDGTPGTNDMPGRLTFGTTAVGASTVTERMRIDSNGQVKIGGSSLTNSYFSLQGTPKLTTTTGIAVRNDSTYDNTVQTGVVIGFLNSHSLGAAGSVSTGYGFQDGTFVTLGATITNYYSFMASAQTIATNNYGFYGNIASGTGRWNIYMNGSADNYLSGNTGIGGVPSGSYKLEVTGKAYASGGIVPRVLASTANSATPTLNTDNYDVMVITGQSVAITSFTTNLTGTPVNGQKLLISITGTTAIAITWGASFESSNVILPITTVTTNRLDVGFIWNAATSKWRCIAYV